MHFKVWTLSVCGGGRRPFLSAAVQNIFDCSLHRSNLNGYTWASVYLYYCCCRCRSRLVNDKDGLSYLVQPPDVHLWQAMVSVILVVKMDNYLTNKQKKMYKVFIVIKMTVT